ncbi:hypothetical protein PANO111632_04035 [Paracoccus nototheniae]
MGLLAGAILIGSIGAAIAYQNGPPAMIGAFDFAYVGFSVIWGIVFFNETPDLIASVGMIFGAGVLSCAGEGREYRAFAECPDRDHSGDRDQSGGRCLRTRTRTR